jgi:hypothetical protein
MFMRLQSLFVLIWPSLLSCTALSAQTTRLKPCLAHIGFLKSEPGGSSTAVRDVKIWVEFWGAKPAKDVALSFKIVNSSNPAIGPVIVNPPVGGFSIPLAKFDTASHDSLPFTVHLSINAVPQLANAESFQIQMNDSAAPTVFVVVDPTPNPPTADQADPKRYRLMFLNALNFDFSGTLTSNYVGSLNLFVPPASKSRWGYNTGVMKISYSGSDSLSSQSRIENVLIHPLDTIGVGSKYVHQLNRYSTTTQNTVWSLFAQPLFRLTSPDKDDQIYLHLHGELLINKWYTKTTVTNLAQDTLTLNNPAGFVARSQVSASSSYSTTLLNGYFGLGLTFDLQPWKNANFFFQPTIGLTTNYPQPAAMDISNNSSTVPVRVLGDKSWNGFYLVRSYLSQKVSDSATIVFGADIRGLFPRYNPQYALFLGLNLQVEGILGLLGIKKQ